MKYEIRLQVNHCDFSVALFLANAFVKIAKDRCPKDKLQYNKILSITLVGETERD